MIGFAITGSFCTIAENIDILQSLKNKGYDFLPIMSPNAYNTDTRFGEAEKIRASIFDITNKDIIHTIVQAETLGPQIHLDALIISPCTGNTLAKIANGITDTSVCMAAKAHLRNNKPLIIALASNDALAGNLQNIAKLLSRKNIYFVPMRQDDPEKKPHSLVADFSLLESTLENALEANQIKRIFL